MAELIPVNPTKSTPSFEGHDMTDKWKRPEYHPRHRMQSGKSGIACRRLAAPGDCHLLPSPPRTSGQGKAHSWVLSICV